MQTRAFAAPECEYTYTAESPIEQIEVLVVTADRQTLLARTTQTGFFGGVQAAVPHTITISEIPDASTGLPWTVALTLTTVRP
ncbi:MAG: hypothetical protein JNJ45_11870 [Chthonomonas sp.]|nr:hypothetical protein [Chthonomonas sp.]